MAFDLTNSNISDTFQHLLQVRADDNTIYDALGNALDDFRLSGSFTTSEFFEIENGKIKGPVNDVAYQSNTQEFWNSCSKICDKSDYKTFGSFFDGKGQPSQISAVSHGSATTRFDGVNVINTARNI